MNIPNSRDHRHKVERKSVRKGAAALRLAGADRRQRAAQSDLAIQLALDPAILSVRFMSSLDLLDRIVPIQMLVAETADGRIAFDIVDHRPERDLDEDGLLLLTLQQHGIRLVEIECATIESEPRASNCRYIWRYRDKRVAADVARAIDRAVAEQSSPTVRALGRIVGLRHPIPTVCALICRKRVQVDLGKRRLDLNSIVRRPDQKARAGFLVQAEARSVRPPTGLGMEYGGNE